MQSDMSPPSSTTSIDSANFQIGYLCMCGSLFDGLAVTILLRHVQAGFIQRDGRMAMDSSAPCSEQFDRFDEARGIGII